MEYAPPVTPSNLPQRPAWMALLLPAAIFIALIAGLIALINAIGLENIRETIASAGPAAPLLYICLKAVTYIVAPLSSGPIQLGSGILFGLWEGVLYTLIGEVIGGCVNFWVARLFGRRAVARLAGEQGLQRIDSLYAQVGEWRSLVYARLFLFSIWDFLSYAAGFTPVRFRSYLIVSVVAGFFPTFLAVALGTVWAEASSGVVILYVLIAIASALPLIFQRRIRRLLRLGDADPKP